MGCKCCKRRVPEVLDEEPIQEEDGTLDEAQYEIQEEIFFDPIEDFDDIGPTCCELAQKDMLQLAKCCFAPLGFLQWSSSSRSPRYLQDRKLGREIREEPSTGVVSVSQLPWDAEGAPEEEGENLAAKQAREVQAEILAALRAKRASEDLANTRTEGEAEIMAMPSKEALETSAIPEMESTFSGEVLSKHRAEPQANSVAGSGMASFGDGKSDHAGFNCPSGVTLDNAGNLIVADTINHRIRKITADGAVSTLAGTGLRGVTDGGRREARFHCPVGVAVDAENNVIVADYLGHAIRMVTPGGSVTTVAGSGRLGYFDGLGATACFNGPRGLALDHDGNIYVADAENHCIRKVRTNGTVTTLAGCGEKGFADGQGRKAMFAHPSDLAFDGEYCLFVSDSANHCIRKVTRTGEVTTWAGSGEPGFADGINDSAQFNHPQGLEVDWQGNVLVSDSHAIRMIAPDGTVSTPVGNGNPGCSDGCGTDASFNSPQGMAVDPEGHLLVADFSNHRIRKVTCLESLSARYDYDEMEMLFSDISSADVTFLVSGELIMAHRSVLEKRAKKLAAEAGSRARAEQSGAGLEYADEEGTTDNAAEVLRVTVVGARGLRNAGVPLVPGNKSDPYCVVSIRGKPDAKFATGVVLDRLDPTWNHTGELAPFTSGDDLEFVVLDKDLFDRSEFLGKATLHRHQYSPHGFEGQLELSPGPGSLQVRVHQTAAGAAQVNRIPDAEVRDTSATAFRALLRFLYTDRLAFHDRDAVRVLELARRYDIRRVYKLCRLYVYRNLSAGNCSFWFVQADAYGIPEIREAALRATAGFMQTNKLQVGGSDALAPLVDKPFLMQEVLSTFAGSRRKLKAANRQSSP